MSEVMVSVKNVSKHYRIGDLQKNRSDSLTSEIGQWLFNPVQSFKQIRELTNFNDSITNAKNILWALRDVSFEVKRGEVFGIIGKNGAGKSTILKILSRVTRPDQGEVMLRGQVASLLEVGTGFHPELTGRDNIYLNASILGMSKHQIDAIFDDIVAFSGVERFIDTPIKRYSSGMAVRLAFSVAINVTPDVLIIDEVLAVGDAEFQKKCFSKIADIQNQGGTIIIVTHMVGIVETMCTNAILLERGQAVASGRAIDVVDIYNAQYANKPMDASESVAEVTNP